MLYKVIDTKTGEDITYDYDWVITPDGELSYLMYGDLIGYKGVAKVVFTSRCNDIP
jgi:hypothetical protein